MTKNRLLYYSLSSLFLFGFIIISFGNEIATWIQSWESTVILVGGHYQVIYKRKPIHPFLAEYRQRVDIKNQKTGATASINLPDNTGGETKVYMYLEDARISEANQVKVLTLMSPQMNVSIDLTHQKLLNRNFMESDGLIFRSSYQLQNKEVAAIGMIIEGNRNLKFISKNSTD